jgi:hypothetical protein
MITALLWTSLSAALPSPPLVNGTPTDLYPEVVLLRFADEGWVNVFVCSGVLVADQWVLTSAHCVSEVQGYDLTEMTAFSGATWEDGVTEVPADDWFIHPDYYVSGDASVIEADLGLVHLTAPIAGLSPLALNDAELDDSVVGERLRWVGWGATGDFANDAGYVKRYADMTVVGLETEYLLAYDEGGAATCGGDSGGAVLDLSVEPPLLLAIHTFGRDDDGTLCEGSTSGDVRVDLYLDWIEENAGLDGGSADGAGDDGSGDGGGGDEGGSTDPIDETTSEDKGGCSVAPGLSGAAGLAAAILLSLRRRRQG